MHSYSNAIGLLLHNSSVYVYSNAIGLKKGKAFLFYNGNS